MKALALALLLVPLLVPLAPTASAHQCASGSSSGDCVCPVPQDGEYHQHASPSGSCQGGPGGSQSATPGGASQRVPAVGILATIGLVAALALLRRA